MNLLMMKNIRNYVAGVALGAASVANGAMMTQLEPDYNSPGYIGVPMIVKNTDIGSTAASVDYNNINSIAQGLLTLPQNSGKSIDDLTSAWKFYIVESDDANATVDPSMWMRNGTGYAPLTVLFDDQGLGLPSDLTYGKEIATRLQVPTSQLDGNGNGWSLSDPADYKIVLGAPMADAAVAKSADGFSTWSAPGNSYTVQAVPEPSVLMGAAVVAYCTLARRQRKTE